MKKIAPSLCALLLSMTALPTLHADDGIFGFECRMRSPVGFTRGPAEKIYVNRDLTLAVYESKPSRSDQVPSYRLAMNPTAPFQAKDPMIFFTAIDREERPIQVLFDLQNSTVTLQKDIDSVGEQAICLPTELEPFDWKDATDALGAVRNPTEGAIFNEGAF